MMKNTTLLVIFFEAVFQLTSAHNPTQGYSLNRRTRSARKLSEISQTYESIQHSGLGQWKEEHYEALVTSNMSGRSNLLHEQL
mmetsp:Transcript_6512/g.12347  ORF Transcript_6512/g.12347 Transcript_6512/m.12347 type:complete len:83 (+) Transcript_6512:257-505(+)